MAVDTLVPKKMSLISISQKNKKKISVPFAFTASMANNHVKSSFLDLKFPWGSTIVDGKIKNISTAQEFEGSCIVFCQLLDNAGRASNRPFFLACITKRSPAANVSLPLVSPQKIRLIVGHNDKGFIPELTISGFFSFSSDSKSIRNRGGSKISKWIDNHQVFSEYDPKRIDL